MERWVEYMSHDYLQFILIWVRIRNIPVNHYTVSTIIALEELIGKVKVVAYDETKAQNKDFVRVRLKFDLSRPLRRSKVINLPGGSSTTILFDYERIQKRCYRCQRLNHENVTCPLVVKMFERKLHLGLGKAKHDPVLKESDPLFGVLEEAQVGIDPFTGRPRIVSEVLEGMRQYLMVDNGEERKIRKERIKNSVKEVEKDPITQKKILRLEDPLRITNDFDKGKGLVFGYDSEVSSARSKGVVNAGNKLMAAAIQSGTTMKWRLEAVSIQTRSQGKETMEMGSFSRLVQRLPGQTSMRLAHPELV